MVLTPQPRRRRSGRLLALLVLGTLLGTACSATPSTLLSGETAAAEADVVVRDTDLQSEFGDLSTPPEQLAFVDDDSLDDAESEMTANLASAEFCEASANIWIHSAALNLIGAEANSEMNQIAFANVAEWLEQSTLFDEDGVADRHTMDDAFAQLREMVIDDFDSDWLAFQASTIYANDEHAQTFETERAALVTFINERCDDLSMSDLRDAAQARATELTDEFATAPSTLTESESLPGHAIFTHSSGRLIASFPTAWDHEEGRGDAIVDLIASPDIERFLDNDAIDGVRLQLLPAATIDDFRALMADTMIGSSCTMTNDLSDSGVVRINITQTFACDGHGASIIGQFSEERELGLLIEASFDREDASRADLIRLSSIANSALWS